MQKKLFLLFLISVSSIFALDKAPWFGDVYEFHFLSKYTYSRYNQVNGALSQPVDAANNNLLHFNLSFAPSMQWSIDSDLEFNSSPHQEFGFCSVAFQARYLIKDDIIGDPVTFNVGANFRVISDDSLKDVNILYHSTMDFEINSALGKEFSKSDFWRFRTWLYLAAGLASKGSPWLKGEFAIEGNIQEKRKWAIFLQGMQGYGKETLIDINNFNGYGAVRQSNLDIGFRYGISMSVWGTLSFEYKRRLLAKTCPENENFFTVCYVLPFSF